MLLDIYWNILMLHGTMNVKLKVNSYLIIGVMWELLDKLSLSTLQEIF
jgi:hypothetical protein